jgi:hypothetical protein
MFPKRPFGFYLLSSTIDESPTNFYLLSPMHQCHLTGTVQFHSSNLLAVFQGNHAPPSIGRDAGVKAFYLHPNSAFIRVFSPHAFFFLLYVFMGISTLLYNHILYPSISSSWHMELWAFFFGIFFFNVIYFLFLLYQEYIVTLTKPSYNIS